MLKPFREQECALKRQRFIRITLHSTTVVDRSPEQHFRFSRGFFRTHTHTHTEDLLSRAPLTVEIRMTPGPETATFRIITDLRRNRLAPTTTVYHAYAAGRISHVRERFAICLRLFLAPRHDAGPHNRRPDENANNKITRPAHTLWRTGRAIYRFGIGATRTLSADPVVITICDFESTICRVINRQTVHTHNGFRSISSLFVRARFF